MGIGGCADTESRAGVLLRLRMTEVVGVVGAAREGEEWDDAEEEEGCGDVLSGGDDVFAKAGFGFGFGGVWGGEGEEEGEGEGEWEGWEYELMDVAALAVMPAVLRIVAGWCGW
ncbi:hypothetical protein PTI98_003942 [Pleurotus ostreatus]|nr:hypothetical protein PTI98_003942 [Pleurotus ostreatus]